MYEKVDQDPSEDTEKIVIDHVKRMVNNNWMEETTAECILERTKDTHPGIYHEFPKTHKINEDSHNFSEGFPARGIVSCMKTPTEALQDYSEMIVSQKGVTQYLDSRANSIGKRKVMLLAKNRPLL